VAAYIFAYGIPVDDGGDHLRALHIPFMKGALIPDMHWFAVAFFTIIHRWGIHAVNLTDGLDGLATGLLTDHSSRYAALVRLWKRQVLRLPGVPHHSLAAELPIGRHGLGRCLSRLSLVNAHPAQDVHGRHWLPGSRRLYRHLASACKQEIILVLVGEFLSWRR